MNSSRDDEQSDASGRAYERGRRDAEPTVSLHELMDQDEPTVVAPVQPRKQPEQAAPVAWESAPATAEPESDRRRTTVVVILCALAVLLVAGAFGIGRLFADSASHGSAGSPSGSSGNHTAAYDGPVDAVRITDSMASCQSDSAVDAAGKPVTYEPAKAHDSDMSTAWRCDGSGVGQRFTVSLPPGTTVAEVGLVPGYAKTDPVSGVDRYAENNRITKVRWTFDDGTSYVQQMSGDPDNRSMRTLRVPETKSSRVVIEILASQPGPRNTVAISELRIGTPAG